MVQTRSWTHKQNTAHIMDIFRFAIPIAMGAVVIVLMLGLWNMTRGGSTNLSQKLMRWRVGLQFVAVILVMAGLYFSEN